MLASLRQRLDRDDDGFTLIELMVVVLIIAILIAIAIPTFLGVQDRAKDRSAQSNLRNALTAAKTIATDDAGEFDTVTVAELTQVEGAYTFQTAESADPKELTVLGGGIAPVDADNILFYAKSDSGKFFGIKATKAGVVTYCSGGVAPTLAACAAEKW